MASPAVEEFSSWLKTLPLGGAQIYEELPSTNDAARTWAERGARDFSLVLAEKQTRGRGRFGRRWFSAAGAALTFSLILRPTPSETAFPAFFSALGAVALTDALRACCASAPTIKWPNDVLLHGKKVAGILVETAWTGERMDFAALGIGLNIKREALPPAEALNFPAGCLEEETSGEMPSRGEILRGILDSIFRWRRSGSAAVAHAWEENLAFRGESVEVRSESGPPVRGILEGLEPDGSLRLRTESGIRHFRFGETHLRPA